MSEYLTRWRERVRRNALLNNAWRVAVFTVGMAVLLAGIAMLVLPGPGWAAIFIGFAILATEFAWARVALLWAKDTAGKAKDKALAPETRRRNQLIAIGGGAVVAAGVIAYLERYGLNLPWATG
ncbi:TIGR02611 family protein [Actinoallomurus acaciae]|uniref:TIGR02611 family protein n=1 Tax=Actinoallomurus acaciae TaxID=502577 RepID=A0ABV5YJZ4_9ACTN